LISLSYAPLQLSLELSLISQSLHLLDGNIKRNELTQLLGGRVISVSDVDSAGLLLLSTDNEDEVVLGELTGTDLLLHGVTGNIDISVHTLAAEQSLELLDVVVDSRHDGDNEDLARRKPEWPLAGKVLGENGDETLERTVDSTVNHDRTLATRGQLTAVAGRALLALLTLDSRSAFNRLLLGNRSLLDLLDLLTLDLGFTSLGTAELKVELLRKLEVELDGGALELTLESVRDGDIDLGAVEGTITRVELPLGTTSSDELIESLSELSFSLVPGGNITKMALRTGGKLHLEGETELAIDGTEEVEETENLRLDLVLGTENVGVVLLEATDSGKTSEGTRSLVTVKNTEIGNSHGQFSVTTLTVREEQTMTRAVHRLQGPLILLNLEGEHVVLVMLPVTRLLPEGRVVHVGGHDLLVTTGPVLVTEEALESVVDDHTVGKEEAGTRRHVVEEEELLLLTNLAVIALGSLLEVLLVLDHHGLVGE
jgi:hypothetical protein